MKRFRSCTVNTLPNFSTKERKIKAMLSNSFPIIRAVNSMDLTAMKLKYFKRLKHLGKGRFLRGMGRALDTGATYPNRTKALLHGDNLQKHLADVVQIASDFDKVGECFESVIGRFKKPLKDSDAFSE